MMLAPRLARVNRADLVRNRRCSLIRGRARSAPGGYDDVPDDGLLALVAQYVPGKVHPEQSSPSKRRFDIIAVVLISPVRPQHVGF